MVDPLTAAAAAGTVLTSFKELSKSAKAVAVKLEDLEQRGRMIDLMEKLQNAQLLAMEQVGRVAELEEENQALRKQLTLRSEMQQEGDVLYRSTGGDTKDGPFCLHCSLQHQREIRLVDGHESYAEYQCPACKEVAGTLMTPPTGAFVV